ncbi:hypothetical protein HZB69_01410 [Candidatus Amesbacteria bacterium]|nr:hypothetical protein [Candidatus Amesbacteria bacterium]
MLIIHGENQIASREYFLDLRTKNPGDILDGDNLTLNDLQSKLNAISLFGETQHIYIENLYSRRPSNEKKAIIEYIESHNPLNLVIWEHKAVTTKAENKNFEMPKYLFAFWNKPTLKNFHLALQVAAVEQIFAGLITGAHKKQDKKTLKEFLDIDYKNKTSALPYDLKAALEFWLIKTHN